MASNITTISLGGVNCYLLKSPDGFALVDTGFSNRRAQLVRALEDAGCLPGSLNCILLTHGDLDHAGNAAFLREKYRTKILMHREDAGLVEQGDPTYNRKEKPDRLTFIGRLVIGLGGLMSSLDKTSPFDPFTPDAFVEDGDHLGDYGLDARVLHLPGHSRGSIAILTADGQLFCGDLLWNMRSPGVHFLVDDSTAHAASVEKMRAAQASLIYPGHGAPFEWSQMK